MAIEYPKGLRGLPGLNKLSAQERDTFLKANAAKLKKYEEEPELYNQAADMLYNNMMFKQTFGSDAFKAAKASGYNMDQRNEMLREKVVNEAFDAAYKPLGKNGQRDNNVGAGKEWETVSQLSTDAKEQLLNSDWKTPSQMANEKENETWYDKATNKWQKVISPISGLYIISDAINETYKEARKQHKKEANDRILQKIYNDDADSASKRLGSEVSQAYINTDVTGKTDDETKRLFIEAITPSKTNMGISEYASHYGDGTDPSSEMKDFTIDDMRQVLAKKAVYDSYMSPQMASAALNNEAKRYIKEHQGSFKRFGLFAKDVGISALSYTADKVNGIYNLGLIAADKLSDWGAIEAKPTVYVDTKGNVIDPKNVVRTKNGTLATKGEDGNFYQVHQEQVDRSTLHNMGKSIGVLAPAGSDDDSILNAAYWTDAEQFGTLSKAEQEQYKKLGSSPYKVAYNPNEDSDLWYESFKMMSFGIADAASMLIPFGVGVAGRALSTASKAGKVVNGLGKGMDTASKYLTYQTRVGQAVQGGAGALGIAYAYNRGAFQETLAQNLANAEEVNMNRSKKEVYDMYQNDKQYKGQIDALINARANEMKANYMAQAAQEGNQVTDSPQLDEMIRARAQEAVLNEMVQQRAEQKKGTQEYAALQQEAINSAGDAAVRTFLPEAIKYGLVNTMGYRKFLYTNPAGLAKKMSSAFKGMEEVTTAEGKRRLMAGASEFGSMAGKAKRFGKIAGSQMWGGAWTNGTDDMMVDAAERTANDSYQRYLNAYENGESVADVYGLVDGLYSYWKGLQNSLGQETTWNAAAVGGLGSVVSASPNMANIAHLASKEGREAYKNSFQKRYVYETDEKGFKKIKRDEQGNPVMEDISASENWRERLNYFIQNGVLNNYYGRKQSERELQNHADYVNKFLDDQNDFDELDDLVTTNILNDNASDVMDKKTARFIHAFNAIKALEYMGNDKNDPLTMSSVVQQHKDLINRAAKLGTEEQDFTEEEINKLAKQYYANNAIPQSEQNTEQALQNIGENARKLQEVYEAYDKAEEHIQKIENTLGTSLLPAVRNRLKLSKALDGHWRERLDTMKDEVGDNSNADKTTGLELVLSYGGKGEAEKFLEAFDSVEKKQIEKKNELLAEVQQKLDIYNEAQENLRNARTSDEQYIAQLALKAAKDSYNEALERKIYNDDVISSINEKKSQLKEALGEWEKDSDRVLSADEIFALDPITRARMMDSKLRDTYSPAQKKQINLLEARLRKEKGEDALQKIQDIATLTQNIAQNEDAYNRISRNPDAAALQFEKQKKQAADAAYELINRRNAKTLADMVGEAEEGLKHRNGVSKEDIDNIAFRMLRKHSPTLLDIIDREEMLPQYQKQLNEAKEWSKITSDIDAVVSSLDENDDVKNSILRHLDSVVEKANSKDEIFKNLEDFIDNTNDPDVAADFDRVLAGLDKLGYTRDATVVENRKQRKARDEATRKKLEEENAKLEAEAKAAAEKAAQETAKKAEETKAATSTPEVVGPLNDIDSGEDVETSSKEQDTEKVTKPSYHSSMKEQIGDKDSTWKYYTDDEKNTDDRTDAIIGPAFQATLVLAINYAVDAGVLAEDYKIPHDAKPSVELSEKIRQATKDLYRLKIRTPQQLIEYVEQHEGESVENRQSTTQQNEESPVTDNTEQADEDVRNEWFGTDNLNDIPLEIENGNYVAESPTVGEEAKTASPEDVVINNTEQLEDPDTSNEQGQESIDTKEDTLSGNPMEEYVTASLKDHVLVRKKGREANDAMNRYFAWMDAEGIKLQDIIDDELYQIMEAYAEDDMPMKVKFMAVKREKNATHDIDMKNHLMLVIDYNDKAKSIHNEDRGGVISVKDKKYLIIGEVGYGKDNKENAGRKKLRDILFNGVDGKGDGLAIKGMGEFFRNNPTERFFVNDALTTEIIPNSLISGYLVKQTKEDDVSTTRTLGELLNDKERNPHGLKLEDLGFYIQEYTQSIATNTYGREVMQPSDKTENAGRVFVLVPSTNGKLIPAHLSPVTYPEMASSEKFGNSELISRITANLGTLVSPPSKENLPLKKRALHELMQTLYLHKDHNCILMSEDGSVISLVRDGENRSPFAVYNLRDSNFSPEGFMRSIYEMNPHINITKSVLHSPKTLKMYDEAGVLQTDLARMYAAGASYSIYPVDAQGRMMKTENAPNAVTWSKGRSEFRDGNRALVYYQGHNYYYDSLSNTFHESQNSPAIQDAELLEQLKLNMQVMNLSPTEDRDGTKIYILKEGEHPEIVRENKNSHRITKMTEQEAKEYLAEREKQKEEKKRDDAIAKANKEREEERAKYVINEEGEITVEQEEQEAQPEKKEEIEVEEEPPTEEHRSRETYADKSVESSAEYKATSSTQTFKQLSKNKKYKAAVFEAINRMPDSPVKFNEKGKLAPVTTEEIENYLKSMKIPIDAIGTSDTDIQAWLHTLECR